MMNQFFLVVVLCSFPAVLQAEEVHTEMSSAKIAENTVIQRIALGSCFAPQLESDTWSAIAKYNPDIFLYLGDNVYQSEETSDMALPHLKEAYQLLSDVQPFSALRSKTPILPIWDDHDFGMDDAGGSWPPKYESQKLFEQVWAIPDDDPRRARDGVYFSRTFGKPGQHVQIIMLDTRFFRSDTHKTKSAQHGKQYLPSQAPTTTMLGKAQWQWLRAKLKVETDIRIIVSSVQVIADGGKHEGWYLFPKERERLLTLLNESNGVILLSGDRHFSSFYQIEKETGEPLLEFTSSSLNLPITGKRRTTMETMMAQFQLNKGVFDANFGTMNIDWSKRQVSLEIRSGENEILQRQVIPIPAK
jgi:alkaline phosphatase D